jgi:hypothetical protein
LCCCTACMHVWSMCMVHKIFLDISRGTMIKTLTSSNPNILSCTAKYFFSSSPSRAMHIGDRRERGGGLRERRSRALSVIVCVHFISMHKCGLVKRDCKLRGHCTTSESEI